MKKLLMIVFGLVILLAVIRAPADASNLKWEASSGDVAGYKIYYGITSGLFPMNEDVGNVLELINIDKELSLVPGTTYYFVVVAYNASGESDHSNSVDYIGVLQIPDPPTNLRIIEYTAPATEPDSN